MGSILIAWIIFHAGCARIFHWDIHAPGLLSEKFFPSVEPLEKRVGLYLSPNVFAYQSQDRGGRFADPQTYHIGEALGPMVLEAFDYSFREFIFMEVEPHAEIMKQYGIAYLVVLQMKDFKNRVTLKTQKSSVVLDAEVYDTELNFLARFYATGESEAPKVFAKKGGPEVNLNAAIENAITSLIYYIHDSVRQQSWQIGKTV